MKTIKYCVEITDLTGQFMPSTDDVHCVLFDKFTHCLVNVYE